MIKNLPRELLWTDMKEISEMKSNKLRKQLYGIISLDQALNSSAWSELDDETMLKLYNEAFYFCTRIVYEHDADTSPETYMEEIMSNLGDKRMSYLVVRLMFYVLCLQSDKSDEVVHFTDKLRKAYFSRTTPIFLNWVNKWFKPRKNNVEYSLKPHPNPASELRNNSIDWHKITQGFSKNIIVELLDLWNSDNEKGKVIRLIENAYKSCQPVSANEEYAGKTDDEFFTQQKNLYNLINDDNEVNVSKGGRPESESLDELFTDSCSPDQRIKLITFVRSQKGKGAAFALRVAALPEVGMIKQVPSYSKAIEYFPNIGASSNYYKQLGRVISEEEIKHYKRMLLPQES